MRKVLVILAVAVMATTAGMSAQSGGAIVDRTSVEGWSWLWDGQRTLLVISTMSNFYCGDDTAAPRPKQFVTVPVGGVHDLERGRWFARLYEGVPEDLLGTEDAPRDPADFICHNAFWAEGILPGQWKDTQVHPTAPGAEIWSFALEGTLIDLVGSCQSAMVGVQFRGQWQILPGWDDQVPECFWFDPSCVQTLMLRGPILRCTR